MGYEPDLKLFINGSWRTGEGRDSFPVVNPVTGGAIAELPLATEADLDEALETAKLRYPEWRATDVDVRSSILHKTAKILKERADAIARTMTQEQGKPLQESKGEVLGAAPRATLTVTFGWPKRGHLLLPGREWARDLAVADIGCRDEELPDLPATPRVNGAPVWRSALPLPSASDHKYSRGHTLVVGGHAMPGATRLASRAAQVGQSARRLGMGPVPARRATAQPATSDEVVQHRLRSRPEQPEFVGPQRALGILRRGGCHPESSFRIVVVNRNAASTLTTTRRKRRTNRP